MSRTHRALAMLALSLALVTATTAAAAATPPTGIEDQHDRLLRNREAAAADRTQAAVALARSMERDLRPIAPAAPAAPPAAQPDPTAPDADGDVLATLLLGLVGGLVGGAAAIGAWMLATRRHRPRPATVT